MNTLPPFHLAIQVHDLAASRAFYGELLGCPEGRSHTTWVDFDFYGHQLVCHQVKRSGEAHLETQGHAVDGKDVPVPHFGAVLEMAAWTELAQRLRDAGVAFVIEPYVRFAGAPGEQATMFLLDPSGNAVEFKAFRDIGTQLFAT